MRRSDIHDNVHLPYPALIFRLFEPSGYADEVWQALGRIARAGKSKPGIGAGAEAKPLESRNELRQVTSGSVPTQHPYQWRARDSVIGGSFQPVQGTQRVPYLDDRPSTGAVDDPSTEASSG